MGGTGQSCNMSENVIVNLGVLQPPHASIGGPFQVKLLMQALFGI